MDSWGVRLTWFDCNQLCRAVERMQASVNSQGRNVGVKSSVTFPVFRGDKCKDAHEFIRNLRGLVG